MRLHGVARPTSPKAEDAIAVLDALGLKVGVERWHKPFQPGRASRRQIVSLLRRQLCVSGERDPEIDAFLGPQVEIGVREVALSWAGSAR